MIDIDLTDTAMPDTKCPTWCTNQAGHRRNWADHIEYAGRPYEIRKNDGGVDSGILPTVAESAESWEPLHLHTVTQYKLGEPHQAEAVRIDISSSTVNGVTDAPCVYVEVEGVMSPEQLRILAADLLNAADTFEGLDK